VLLDHLASLADRPDEFRELMAGCNDAATFADHRPPRAGEGNHMAKPVTFGASKKPKASFAKKAPQKRAGRKAGGGGGKSNSGGGKGSWKPSNEPIPD
jgi:hypothetical protein